MEGALYCPLLPAANVSSRCLNKSNNYGFDTNHPCVLLHLSRVSWDEGCVCIAVANGFSQVFQWSPESLYSFLRPDPPPAPAYLNISCFTDDSNQVNTSSNTPTALRLCAWCAVGWGLGVEA